MAPGSHAPNVMKDLESFFVRLCGCGVIHLAFGPCTLNLTPDAFHRVADLLSHLSEELKARESNAAAELPSNVIAGRFTASP